MSAVSRHPTEVVGKYMVIVFVVGRGIQAALPTQSMKLCVILYDYCIMRVG